MEHKDSVLFFFIGISRKDRSYGLDRKRGDRRWAEPKVNSSLTNTNITAGDTDNSDNSDNTTHTTHTSSARTTVQRSRGEKPLWDRTEDTGNARQKLLLLFALNSGRLKIRNVKSVT